MSLIFDIWEWLIIKSRLYDHLHSIFVKNKQYSLLTKKIRSSYFYTIKQQYEKEEKIKWIELTEGEIICGSFTEYIHQIKTIIKNIINQKNG